MQSKGKGWWQDRSVSRGAVHPIHPTTVLPRFPIQGHPRLPLHKRAHSSHPSERVASASRASTSKSEGEEGDPGAAGGAEGLRREQDPTEPSRASAGRKHRTAQPQSCIHLCRARLATPWAMSRLQVYKSDQDNLGCVSPAPSEPRSDAMRLRVLSKGREPHSSLLCQAQTAALRRGRWDYKSQRAVPEQSSWWSTACRMSEAVVPPRDTL